MRANNSHFEKLSCNMQTSVAECELNREQCVENIQIFIIARLSRGGN